MPSKIELLKRESKSIAEEITKLRRNFHRYPASGFKEHKAAEMILKALNELGLNDVEKIGDRAVIENELNQLNEDIDNEHGPTGVTASIKGDQAGNNKTILLRADMDALAINEAKEKHHKPYSQGFASEVPGMMHACGHDAHMAMLIGAAKILSQNTSLFTGNVKLLFQPDEERGCGAKVMKKAGIMEGVDAVFGLHVWTPEYAGKVMIHEQETMASVDNFWITVEGGGGHSSRPHSTSDPILAAADLIKQLYQVHDRETDAMNPSVITVENIYSGADWGVIPGKAELKGTIRTFDSKEREKLLARIKEACSCIGDFHRLTISFENFNAFPPLINSSNEVSMARESAAEIIGENNITTGKPIMSGEDFAYYLQDVPGAFIFLGNYNAEKGITHPHHNSRFDVDESILHVGSALLANIAVNYLNE